MAWTTAVVGLVLRLWSQRPRLAWATYGGAASRWSTLMSTPRGVTKPGLFYATGIPAGKSACPAACSLVDGRWRVWATVPYVDECKESVEF